MSKIIQDVVRWLYNHRWEIAISLLVLGLVFSLPFASIGHTECNALDAVM